MEMKTFKNFWLTTYWFRTPLFVLPLYFSRMQNPKWILLLGKRCNNSLTILRGLHQKQHDVRTRVCRHNASSNEKFVLFLWLFFSLTWHWIVDPDNAI